MPYEITSKDREVITKLWGVEEVLVNNDLYCSKLMHIQGGFMCSLHYHTTKDETFFAVEGDIWVEYYPDGKKCETILRSKHLDGLHLPPGTAHRFWSLGPNAIMLEISTPHSDADVVRLEPSRAR